MASDIIPATRADGEIKGFDIGTGANCIYPLLGASILGWKFVGSGALFYSLSLISVLTLFSVLCLMSGISCAFVRYY